MTFTTLNPWNLKEAGQKPYSTLASDLSALSLLRENSSWRRRSPVERVEVLISLAEGISERYEDFALAITRSMGKPITEARAEVKKSIELFHYFKDLDLSRLEKNLPLESVNDCQAYEVLIPRGVILGVMPWNFPLWQTLRFALPTLIAGNSVALRPAESTGSIQFLLQELIDNIPEIPVKTFLSSHENIKSIILENHIDGLSFTGSSETGALLASYCGQALIPSIVELGGSDAFTVYPDSNIEAAVTAAVKSRFLNNGQSCIGAKRLLVHEKVFSEFKELFIKKVAALKLGPPENEKTQLGPLSSSRAKSRLLEQLNNLASLDGKRLFQGDMPAEHEGLGVCFPPEVWEVRAEALVSFDQELFGPIALLTSFSSHEEGLALSNASSYGLGHSLWSKDQNIINDYIYGHECGMIFIEELTFSASPWPFGGVKKSGLGKELGPDSPEAFMVRKTVVLSAQHNQLN